MTSPSPYMLPRSVLLIYVLVQYCCYIAAATYSVTELALKRHILPPLNKNADTEYPNSQESKDMLSPCKPDNGGYFGGTSGDPATIQYGFEVESVINADISDALYMIRETLMDILVAVTFPSVCSYRDLSLTTPTNLLGDTVGVTGFRFGENYDAVQSCIPQLTIHSDCSIFIGTLSVFGTSLTASSLQNFLETLIQEFPTVSEDSMSGNISSSNVLRSVLTNYGVNRLNISPRFSRFIHLPQNDGTSDISVMSIGEKIGVLLLVLSIVVGLAVLIRYLRINRLQQTMSHGSPAHKKEHYGKKNQSLPSWFWSFFNTGSHKNCDSTHSSFSSISGLSAGIPNEQRSRYFYTRTSNFPLPSTQYSIEEPDSIYIVEPDDEFWDSCSVRSVLTEEMGTGVADRDPLFDCDSYQNTREFGFVVN